MLFNVAQLFTLAVAGLAAAVPTPGLEERQASNVIVGYRTVSPAEAAAIQAAGQSLVYDRKKALGGTQLGPGIYTTARPAAWNLVPDDHQYCAITMDQAKFEKTNKIWIPEFNGPMSLNKKLWFASDKEIDQYIKRAFPKLDPSKTMRMSQIRGQLGDLQMVIPPALVGSKGGPLNIHVVCGDKPEDMGAYIANYTTWKNTYGFPQPQLSNMTHTLPK